MVTDQAQNFDIRSEPLYQESLLHFQTGSWNEAIRCLQLLAQTYPDDPLLQAMLDEAQFKAELDRTTRVRAKRWVKPRWIPALARLALIIAIVVAGIWGVRAIVSAARPMFEEAQATRRQEALLKEALTYLEAEELDAAEQRFQRLLAEVPDHPEAQEALAYIAGRRELQALYERGVRLQESGELEEALQVFQEVNRRVPRYRDVLLRIETIHSQQGLAELLAAADQSYKLGRTTDAIAQYEMLRSRNLRYEAELVTERLFELYMRQGRFLINQNPPVVEDVPQALAYFTQAVALKPRDQAALLEQRLARLFVEGQTFYYDRRWSAAVERLQPIYEQRPDYLGGMILEMLYEAYVRAGDQYRDSGDLYLAYEMYRRAESLPVRDTAWARGRLAFVQPQLTPTPTPLPTPTPRPGAGGPGGAPTPIPRLETLRNKIVFFSEANGYPEIWAIDPDGKNRQPLGAGWDLRLQFDALLQKQQYGPDGVTYVYVQDTWNDRKKEWIAQIFLLRPPDPVLGNLPPVQLTHTDGLCYHPVISPDGTQIAYVCQSPSDDIFVMNLDGTEQRKLVDNVWEWDKHPSWSPDGKRIVFWSNRTGIKQLWVMNADGTNLVNISNTRWDEYDPIWVK